MRHLFFVAAFFSFSTTGSVYAQLQKVPIISDPSRAINFSGHSVSQKNNSNARTESTNNTVTPSVTIRVVAGDTLRCADDNSLIRFQALPLNGGDTITLEWLVNDILVGTGSVYFNFSPQDGQAIKCRLTSNLPCVTTSTVISNTINISVSSSIVPSVSLTIKDGNNPTCGTGNERIEFIANPVNCGPSPVYQWYYNGSLIGANSSTFVLDSMSNNCYIYCIVTRPLSCTVSKQAISDTITRKVYRAIAPDVSVAIESVTYNDCSTPTYKVIATNFQGGSDVTYDWYVNGALTLTTTGNTFSAPLGVNGFEIYAVMNSTLSCANPKNIASNVIQRADTINIPFFDDFFSGGPQPSKLLWIKNGGTYINNTLCTSPPTQNVASFDGLMYNGSPYDTVNVTARGVTDNLTSLPIDLSPYASIDSTSNDSLYVVFFWQPGGFGEIPDPTQGDKLSLYFKSNIGEWVEVWNTNVISLAGFNQEAVHIYNKSGNTFLYKGFQFKFETQGRLSGMYDIWNIDYVYLSKKIDPQSISFNDQAFSKSPGSILKKYTSMPLDHYKLKKHKELRDSLSTTLNNLSASFYNIGYKCNLFDKSTGTYSKNILNVSGKSIERFDKGYYVGVAIDSTLISDTVSAPFELRYKFSVNGDSTNSDGKGIPYPQNNEISGVTILDNYFSYDDGSAEYGIGLNAKFAQLAYRFYAEKTDTLKEIAISFVKFGVAIFGPTLNITVWKSLPSNPNSNSVPEILYKKNFSLKYPAIDQFTVFALDSVVVVSDSFYVGFQQVTDDLIAVGWDKNTTSTGNIFYSTSAMWQNYTDEQGSMMIRPVFGHYHYLTKIDETKPLLLSFGTIYPNPSVGMIYFDDEPENIWIYDIQGSLRIHSYLPGKELKINELTDGLYIARIEWRGKYFTRKIILQRSF